MHEPLQDVRSGSSLHGNTWVRSGTFSVFWRVPSQTVVLFRVPVYGGWVNFPRFLRESGLGVRTSNLDIILRPLFPAVSSVCCVRSTGDFDSIGRLLLESHAHDLSKVPRPMHHILSCFFAAPSGGVYESFAFVRS